MRKSWEKREQPPDYFDLLKTLLEKETGEKLIMKRKSGWVVIGTPGRRIFGMQMFNEKILFRFQEKLSSPVSH